ncbi:MAG: tripartite tricarboxylate transporter TctB family protein [Acidiferrobacterales bacterium]|nr:tripartite tricarboxylate transporter TctB family protein [Acidiferrobacterales bacterium]
MRRSERRRSPGDIYFASFLLVVAVLLLSQIGSETTWVKGTKFFSQPRFWPAVSLIGMTGFALIYFLGSFFSYRDKEDLRETILWAKSLEYALWFMAYVLVVPIFGYLLCTILFVCALSWRSGYRDKGTFMMACAVSVVIVVVFKGFLSVKIPGALLYEHLPDSIRNFMILYM